MTCQIKFHSAADAEFNEAARWYEDQRSGLGIEFIDDIQAVLDSIMADPHRYPVAYGDIREAIASRFPYCVYYRVKRRLILITAVFHTSRDPAVLQSRN